MTSLMSYGLFIPRYRLSRKEIAAAWGSCAAALEEKSVPDQDEDCLTMAVAAAHTCLEGGPPGTLVGSVSFATSTPPYAEKSHAGSLRAALNLDESIWTTEHTSSTRSGTEAMLVSAAGLGSPLLGSPSAALVVAADAPKAAVSAPLDHGLGAASTAFLLGQGPGLATLEAAAHWVDEQLGDRFRRAGEGAVQVLGVPGYAASAYSHAIKSAVTGLLRRLGAQPGDFSHVVLHPIDGRNPGKVGLSLGFTAAQLDPVGLYRRIGDSGAAGPLVGLIAALELASVGDRILAVSYGGGAAADALAFRVTGLAQQKQVQRCLERRRPISYMQYLKVRGALSGGGA